MRITQRLSMVFAGLAVLGLASASPALGTQEPQQPPQEQQQQPREGQPIEGELVSVDTDAKKLTVKVQSGDEVQVLYNDATEVTGASGAAGLATVKQSRVTIHFTEDEEKRSKVATRIIVQPAQ